MFKNFYDWHENIRRIRKSKNVTQQELADLLGMSRTILSRYESGIVSPTIDTLIRICDILDVDLFIMLAPKI